MEPEAGATYKRRYSKRKIRIISLDPNNMAKVEVILIANGEPRKNMFCRVSAATIERHYIKVT